MLSYIFIHTPSHSHLHPHTGMLKNTHSPGRHIYSHTYHVSSHTHSHIQGHKHTLTHILIPSHTHTKFRIFSYTFIHLHTYSCTKTNTLNILIHPHTHSYSLACSNKHSKTISYILTQTHACSDTLKYPYSLSYIPHIH